MKKQANKNDNRITRRQNVRAMEFSFMKTGENEGVCAFVKGLDMRAVTRIFMKDKKTLWKSPVNFYREEVGSVPTHHTPQCCGNVTKKKHWKYNNPAVRLQIMNWGLI